MSSKKKLGQAVGRQYRYGLQLISTQGKTFWNIVRSDVKILRQVSEVNLNPSEYTFQSLQIQNLGAETRAIWKQFDFGNKKNYIIFCFIIISHIQLKFIGKENPIWAREDLIKKFCFQIELVLRQDIRTVQNINNKGFCQPPRICQNKPSMKNLSKNFVKNLLLVQPFPPDSVLVAQPGSTLLDKTCAGDNVSLSTNFQISSWHKIIKAFASAKEYYLRFSIVKEAVRVRICRSYQNFYFKYTMIFWGNWSLLWN